MNFTLHPVKASELPAAGWGSRVPQGKKTKKISN